jgi:Cupin-like domain
VFPLFRPLKTLALALVTAPVLALLLVNWWLRCKLGLFRGKRVRSFEVPAVTHDNFDAIVRAKQPVVLTQIVPKWKAFTRWTPEYLVKSFGEQRVSVYAAPLAEPFFDGNNATASVTLSSLFERVQATGPVDGVVQYLWSTNWDAKKSLHEDVRFPNSAASRALDGPGSGILIGERGTITGLHYDYWHGFLAQIRGRKRVLLFPPEESKNLYVAMSPARMTHLPIRSLSADKGRFPKIQKAAHVELVLEPGQVLYIPPFWFHEVEALEGCISMAFRYKPSPSEFLPHPGLFVLVMPLIAAHARAAFSAPKQHVAKPAPLPAGARQERDAPRSKVG